MSEERIARLAMTAKKHEHKTRRSPCQCRRHSSVSPNERKELIRDLSGGNPPRDHRSDCRSHDKREQLSRHPALDFWARAFQLGSPPDEIIPGKQSADDGQPSVERDFMIEPEPSAKKAAAAMRRDHPRQHQPSESGITGRRLEQRDQTHQLKPLPRGHSSATCAHFVLGLEFLAAVIA